MSKADLYRRYAADCLRLVGLAASFHDRLKLLCMALEWDYLAECIDVDRTDDIDLAPPVFRPSTSHGKERLN